MSGSLYRGRFFCSASPTETTRLRRAVPSLRCRVRFVLDRASLPTVGFPLVYLDLYLALLRERVLEGLFRKRFICAFRSNKTSRGTSVLEPRFWARRCHTRVRNLSSILRRIVLREMFVPVLSGQCGLRKCIDWGGLWIVWNFIYGCEEANKYWQGILDISDCGSQSSRSLDVEVVRYYVPSRLLILTHLRPNGRQTR